MHGLRDVPHAIGAHPKDERGEPFLAAEAFPKFAQDDESVRALLYELQPSMLRTMIEPTQIAITPITARVTMMTWWTSALWISRE